MSIDCLGYNGISKSYIQRGGTLITRKIDGRVDIKMIPLTRTVSKRMQSLQRTFCTKEQRLLLPDASRQVATQIRMDRRCIQRM